MEFTEFVNGKLLKVHDVRAACDNFTQEIIANVSYVQGQNDRLREENKKLKDEHYKDIEIQRLVEENERLRERLSESFEIDEEGRANLYQWQKDHLAKKHHGQRYGGAIGGRFTYSFTPTSIGTIASIKCSCGAEYCFKELS